MNRYRVALGKGRAEYEKAIDEDIDLLESFGLKLLSVEGELRAVSSKKEGKRINPWDVMKVDMEVWNWLRPLLLELHERREEEEGEEMWAIAAN